jgi:hypothetical protein
VYLIHFRGLKQPRREAHQTSSSSTKVKNAYTCPP